MRPMRLILAGVVACLALVCLASLQFVAAQPTGAGRIIPPLGQTVKVVHTGMGSQFTGQLVAQDRDWLVVKVGEAKFWVSRPQVVYIQHPAPIVAPPPPAE
jgi:hypothetical protein